MPSLAAFARHAGILALLLLPLCSAQAQHSPLGGDQIVPLGRSLNIYSILLEQQNQVAYNADLNALVFGHREGFGSPGGTGGIAYDRSLDGGLNWTVNNDVSPAYLSGSVPDIIGGRYPNAAIANLDGNTDPSRALAYLQGPALTTNTAYSWGKVFSHSAALNNGSHVDERYANSFPGVDEDYHPMGLTALNNGRLISVSTRFRDDPLADFDRMQVHIGGLDTALMRVRWALGAQLVPNYFRLNNGAVMVSAGGVPNMAFGPDKQVGYIVTMGARVGDPQRTPTPIVYRSLDAGLTWEELPGYAFGEDSSMGAYLQPTNAGEKLPLFDGFDMAVDRDDRLHLFARVRSRLSSDLDSTALLHETPGDGGLFHLITRDGAQWDVVLVDSLRNSPGILGNVEQPNRVQLSRSQDGGRVFFTWSATAGPLGSPNDAPNVWMRGYGVDDRIYSNPYSPTQGSILDGTCWFPTVAPEVMQGDTTVDWAIPTVVGVPTGTDLAPVDYFFLRNAGFSGDDFPQALCNSMIVPGNQSHQSRPAYVELHWDPMPDANACQVQLKKVPSGPSRIRTLLDGEINSLELGYAGLPAGSDIAWRVRCACSFSPLDTSSYSAFGDTIRVPALLRETPGALPPSGEPSGSGLRLSPNPASGQVLLQLEERGLKDLENGGLMPSASGESVASASHTIRLYDATGRLVLEQTFQSNTAVLDLAGLAEGCYVVEALTADGRLFQREQLMLVR